MELHFPANIARNWLKINIWALNQPKTIRKYCSFNWVTMNCYMVNKVFKKFSVSSDSWSWITTENKSEIWAWCLVNLAITSPLRSIFVSLFFFNKVIFNSKFFVVIIFSTASKQCKEIDSVASFTLIASLLSYWFFNFNQLIEICFFIKVIGNYNLASIFYDPMTSKCQQRHDFLVGVFFGVFLYLLNILFKIALRRSHLHRLQLFSNLFAILQFYALKKMICHQFLQWRQVFWANRVTWNKWHF